MYRRILNAVQIVALPNSVTLFSSREMLWMCSLRRPPILPLLMVLLRYEGCTGKRLLSFWRCKFSLLFCNFMYLKDFLPFCCEKKKNPFEFQWFISARLCSRHCRAQWKNISRISNKFKYAWLYCSQLYSIVDSSTTTVTGKWGKTPNMKKFPPNKNITKS